MIIFGTRKFIVFIGWFIAKVRQTVKIIKLGMIKEKDRMLKEQEYIERELNHDVIISDYDSKEPLL